MATTVTTWKPHTCECEVQFSWDPALPTASQVYTFSRLITQGPEHASLSGQALVDALITENRLWNQVVGFAQADSSTASIVVTKANPAGGTMKDFAPGAFSWSYDAARALHISLPTVSASTKTSIQNALNSQFGAGKVTVV